MGSRYDDFACSVRTGGQLERHGLLGKPGYTLPPIDDAIVVGFEQLKAGMIPNLRIAGSGFGAGNVAIIEAGATVAREIRIHTLPRTTGAVILIGRDLTLHGDLRLMGADQTVILAGGRAEVGAGGKLSAALWGARTLLFIGAKSTTNGNQYVLSGDGVSVIVGDDCMFADGIHISTHDQHAVLDIESNTMINPPGDVLIEPHVWLGRRTTVGKGVAIGLGSVVGAHSLVTRGCPRLSVVGGSPAKVIRSGATWDRSAVPRRDTVARVKALAEVVPAPAGAFR